MSAGFSRLPAAMSWAAVRTLTMTSGNLASAAVAGGGRVAA